MLIGQVSALNASSFREYSTKADLPRLYTMECAVSVGSRTCGYYPLFKYLILNITWWTCGNLRHLQLLSLWCFGLITSSYQLTLLLQSAKWVERDQLVYVFIEIGSPHDLMEGPKQAISGHSLRFIMIYSDMEIESSQFWRKCQELPRTSKFRWH